VFQIRILNNAEVSLVDFGERTSRECPLIGWLLFNAMNCRGS